MTESMLQRVGRILNARIEDAVDKMERSGSAGVMREAIREVDRAIEQVRDDHDLAKSYRLQAARQQKALRDRAESLTEKARFAVAEGRDDLAEAALSRQLEFEEQATKLDLVQAQSVEAEASLGESLVALAARRREMEEAMRVFLAARQTAPQRGNDAPERQRRGIERRVSRAEQAFDRAMGGAGGDPVARADGDTLTRVAEIEVMQKRAIVAARLSMVKQAVATA